MASPLSSPESAISPPSRRSVPQTLLIDADDTLWENNIYFERAIAAFISYWIIACTRAKRFASTSTPASASRSHSTATASQSFRRSLIDCFEQLSDGPITPEKHTRIVSFTQAIASHEIELLERC